MAEGNPTTSGDGVRLGDFSPGSRRGSEAVRKNHRTLAYVLVVIVAALAPYIGQQITNDKIKSNQLQACERGNVLRTALSNNTKVQARFLRDARDARAEAAVAYRLTGDFKQAHISQTAADNYNEELGDLTPVPITICKDVIK